jgi:hypothetical protein
MEGRVGNGEALGKVSMMNWENTFLLECGKRRKTEIIYYPPFQ